VAALEIRVAAVQMRAAPGRVGANLALAGDLVAEAARAGARLVVLPELFNTGYTYGANLSCLTETPGGPTCTWLREAASRHGVYLAGSLLLRKRTARSGREDVYNTLALMAPNGREWEYDKLCPWGWERALFRAGAVPVVADTGLGRLGLMICWDVAHPALFRAYAGKVQLLVVSSCPPALERMEICFPGSERLALADVSRAARAMCDRAHAFVDGDLRAQAAWLGVPLVSAMQHGRFTSGVPRPVASLALLLLLNPRLWPLARHLSGASIAAPYNEHTLVADGAGRVLARAGAADGLALAGVVLPGACPRPSGPQPRMQMSPLAYVLSGVLGWLSNREYRRTRRISSRSI
jgi:predicted amidohydrolase